MVLLGPATVKAPNFFAPSRQAKKESPCKHAPTIRHSCMTFRLGVHVGSGNHLNGQPGFTGLRLVRMFKVFGANPLLAWMVVPFHVNRKHVPFFSMAIATNINQRGRRLPWPKDAFVSSAYAAWVGASRREKGRQSTSR